eukprot:CAMPEP_0168613196 /NCGR_PEP_ID=MMETSP0449_2-20121227/3324_1 /TAXON_ID=1082188 /ORGANISM="Strombidium rassoulzadegani, Strain ras09" /LENGTH=53 /DNA_ID=CAMNT_0008653817 /DNA_START=593 /DNA_END=754 /DNA_ORIENTATION=-
MDDFYEDYEDYLEGRDELLGFYNHLGLLIDFNVARGYEDYEKLKQQVQMKCKH